jgi:hypothetical protein
MPDTLRGVVAHDLGWHDCNPRERWRGPTRALRAPAGIPSCLSMLSSRGKNRPKSKCTASAMSATPFASWLPYKTTFWLIIVPCLSRLCKLPGDSCLRDSGSRRSSPRYEPGTVHRSRPDSVYPHESRAENEEYGGRQLTIPQAVEDALHMILSVVLLAKVFPRICRRSSERSSPAQGTELRPAPKGCAWWAG